MTRNAPADRILDTEPVNTLARIVEEATRSTREGAKRFVEPAEGTLGRAKSRRHHIVFGRRGSGKSSLLTKAAAELTVDRCPIVFVDLEEFKGHTYPDVLISVLIRALGEFETWLKTAAINPGNKKSFWDKLFGAVPRRPALKKTPVADLNATLGQLLTELKTLLYQRMILNVRQRVKPPSKRRLVCLRASPPGPWVPRPASRPKQVPVKALRKAWRPSIAIKK